MVEQTQNQKGPFTPHNPASIQEMFGVISNRYDLANSVLSFGIHHRWKRRLIQESGIKKGGAVLDCATGTGDLAFLFESALKGTGQVIGSDFCEPMLQVAREKAKKLKSKVQFETADVTQLQYPSQTFDVASISFGIRNVQNPQRALSELGRVVKSGGRVLVLEFGQPKSPVMEALYGFYSKQILPTLGGWMSGQPKAYRYLQTSSASFPCEHDFLDIAFSTRQFATGRFIPFQTGIAFLYVLQRI
jgi:demethylmenaquinone methyltransferase/2-methoxy-6-polyprenyl-1,4-benzoquinol methylase